MIRSNEFHTYFRVNSVFWDPNVYGRYLALVIVVAMAALLWVKERRAFALLTVLVAVLWLGLAQTFSQSSFIALLAGLAVLAAIRWSWRWTLAAVAVGVVGAALVVTLVGGKSVNASNLFDRLNVDTSGRANLVSGGLDLFAERPIPRLRLRLLPSTPTATTAPTKTSPSRSPTPSPSPSPPSKAS